MAGIFDTLAQVRMDQPNPSAEWAKQVEAANAKATAIKAARGAVPAAASATGPLYGAGKFLGRMAGRFGPAVGLGAMGFGMADQAAAIQDDPESKPLVERTLQVLSGADVTGFGAWMGRKLTGRPEPVAEATPAPGFGVTKPAYISPTYGVAPSGMVPTDMDAHRAAYDKANSAPGGWMSPGGFGVRRNTGADIPPDTIDPNDQSRGAIMARAVGAVMNQKRGAATDARRIAEGKIAASVSGNGPAAAKAMAETARLNELSRLALLEPDPAKRAALLGGPGGPAPARLQSPVNMQPMPGDKDQSATVFDPNTGDYRRVPIRTQIRGAVGTDGKYYKLDSAGKQVEMTSAEKAQFIAQKRGLGAVQ